jgi:hypothetical protein
VSDDHVTVATTGNATMIVSTVNGSIKKGDYLTSSTQPGVAMKQTQVGHTIAVALADFDGVVATGSSTLAVTSTSSGDISTSSGTLQDRLAAIIRAENAPKVGLVRALVRPGFVMPKPDCDMSDILCRSNYFALLTGDSADSTVSPFDGFISSGYVHDLVVYGALIVSQLHLSDNVGRTTVPANSKQFVVPAPRVTAKSIVQITFESDYGPATRFYVTNKLPGVGFTVVFDQAIGDDVTMDWWIVENDKSSVTDTSSQIVPTPTPILTETPVASSSGNTTP